MRRGGSGARRKVLRKRRPEGGSRIRRENLRKWRPEGKIRRIERRHPAAMRAGGTPVPIPNTTVKPCTADGTMLETAWESRRLPDFLKRIRRCGMPGLIAQQVRAHA